MKENSLAAAPFCLAIRGSSEASRFCCTEDESFDEAVTLDLRSESVPFPGIKRDGSISSNWTSVVELMNGYYKTLFAVTDG